jgi:hypothetical protein
MANKETPSGPTTVIEPDDEKGIKTRLVLMSKATSDDGAAGQGEGPVPANITWVLKPMVARSRGRGGVPPSIGSMPVPGKP